MKMEETKELKQPKKQKIKYQTGTCKCSEARNCPVKGCEEKKPHQDKVNMWCLCIKTGKAVFNKPTKSKAVWPVKQPESA